MITGYGSCEICNCICLSDDLYCSECLASMAVIDTLLLYWLEEWNPLCPRCIERSRNEIEEVKSKLNAEPFLRVDYKEQSEVERDERFCS